MPIKHVSLADGGNEFAYPGSPVGASATGYTNVRPAEHHQRRSYSIEKQINTGARPFMSTEGDVMNEVANGDTFDTHIIGAPALIKAVSLHVKRGLDTTANSPNKGTTATLVPYLQDQNDSSYTVNFVDNMTGNDAIIDLTSGAESVYYLSPTDGATLNKNRVLKLMFKYASELPETAPVGAEAPPLEGCFNAVVWYDWLENDGPCDCTPKQCPADYPEPICAPRV